MIIERDIHRWKVIAECAEPHAAMARSALGVFARLADAGTSLRADLQVRFGWSMLRLEDEAPRLRVVEPEFARWPELRWAPTVDTTLRITAAQISLLRQLTVDGDDAYFDQSIVAAPKAIEQADVFLRRVPRVSPKDSGWLLGAQSDPEALGGNQLDGVSIASLVTRRPALLQVLALPSEFVVLFRGDSLEQIFDAAGRPRLAAGL